MLVDFVVPGIPRTSQTKKPKSRRDWRAKVSLAATQAWSPTSPPLKRELSAVIIHYYTGGTDIDVDGIGKLVLDALKGAIIEDDGVFSQVLLRKSNQVGLEMSNPPPLLAETLGAHDSFLYVCLGEAPNHREIPL